MADLLLIRILSWFACLIAHKIQRSGLAFVAASILSVIAGASCVTTRMSVFGAIAAAGTNIVFAVLAGIVPLSIFARAFLIALFICSLAIACCGAKSFFSITRGMSV